MKYITISEAAKKLDLSERSIRNYCQHKRIPGAYLDGKTWMIPENFSRPTRSNGKENDNNDEFIATGYDLVKFIDNSPVNFFAIDNAKNELLKNGYVLLGVVDKNKNSSFLLNTTSEVELKTTDNLIVLGKESFS